MFSQSKLSYSIRLVLWGSSCCDRMRCSSFTRRSRRRRRRQIRHAYIFFYDVPGACELLRWRTAKLSNRQGELAQETPPTVKSSSWWLISADVRLAPLSEEKTLPQGECITAFVCCQSEMKCPYVLKPAEAHYLPSAKPVITVTRSALRLPVSNPLLASLSFLKRADEICRILRVFFNRVHPFLLCTFILCLRNTLLAVLLWW